MLAPLSCLSDIYSPAVDFFDNRAYSRSMTVTECPACGRYPYSLAEAGDIQVVLAVTCCEKAIAMTYEAMVLLDKSGRESQTPDD